MSANISLLPNGLLDLLPPQAENEARAIDLFMKEFAAFGYQRVKPPLVEFEESLLSGPGQALSRKMFRLMDPVSQRMMGVRPDVTAQIARIAGSRLSDEPRPLRLSYAADVLRVNGTQLRAERQFCQVGCELVGMDTVMADAELALIALKALSSAGIPGLSIDLSVPTLIQHVYEETGLDDAARATMANLIEKRDRDAIAAHNSPAASIIDGLLGCEGTAARAIEAMEKLSLPAGAKADAQRLIAVARELQAALGVYGLPDVQVTIDPLEYRGFEYQTGISFTLFAKNARGELGRGGRYDIVTGETATGFTLYMDTILRVLPSLTAAKVQAVSPDAGWDQVKALQDQGICAVRR